MKSATGTLLVILAIGFVAPLAVAISPRLRLPALVIEILLGIVVGPAVLDWVAVTEPIELLSELGLATLIFMAGFEIDPARLKGRPAALGLAGWFISVGLGLAVAMGLHATGLIKSELYVGFALTTTALGALLPIVRDAGLLPTPFGTHILAIGSVGEFGPIIAVALVLSGTNPARSAIALLAFAAVAVASILVATKLALPRLRAALSKTLHSSGQLHVRLALVLVAVMAYVADRLGLDFLLGAFTAGVLYRMFVTGDPESASMESIESKLEAVAFGYVIPIFFVVTGINFDVNALTSSPTAMLKVPLFLVLFLLVRGVPTLLYRKDLPTAHERTALAFLSATALPLVVVITEIGVEAGQMRASTAAALVGAGMCSIVAFPLIGFTVLRTRGSDEQAAEPTPQTTS